MMGKLQAWQTVALALALAGGFGAAAHGGEREFSGQAAYYNEDYKGVMASGAPYDPEKLTCAHRTLPFGTRLLVTDQKSKRSVVVIVTDRGPFNKKRVIDLSLAAAKILQMSARGLIQVTAVVQ